MAVEDKYTNADLVAGKKAAAFQTGSGAKTVTMIATIAVAAADDDGSVYRAFANVPSAWVPVNIAVHNDAITGGTDYDLGLYKAGVGGAAVDADVLADGLDLSSAAALSGWNNAGLTTVAVENLGDLATLGGESEPEASYDIALTANTVGSAAGDIRITATFVYQ